MIKFHPKLKCSRRIACMSLIFIFKEMTGNEAPQQLITKYTIRALPSHAVELLDNITGIAPVTGIAPGHHRSAIKDGSKGPIGGMNVHHTLPGLCSPSWAVGHPQRTQKCINFLSIGHVQTLYSISEKSHKIMNQLLSHLFKKW